MVWAPLVPPLLSTKRFLRTIERLSEICCCRPQRQSLLTKLFSQLHSSRANHAAAVPAALLCVGHGLLILAEAAKDDKEGKMTYMYIYICMYVYIYISTYVYIYMYMYLVDAIRFQVCLGLRVKAARCLRYCCLICFSSVATTHF